MRGRNGLRAEAPGMPPVARRAAAGRGVAGEAAPPRGGRGARRRPRAPGPPGFVLGGPGIRARAPAPRGRMVVAGVRAPTPVGRPPQVVIEALAKLVAPLPAYD